MDTGIFYRAVGGEVLEFLRDWRERTKAVEAVYGDFAKSKGGIGFTRYVGMRFGGVVFEGEPPLGWKRHKRPCSDGVYFSLPVKRGAGSKEGKVFEQEIAALPALPSEDEFCERFNIPQSLSYRKSEEHYGSCRLTAIAWKVAEIAWVNSGDSFWVVLPDIDSRMAKYAAEGYSVTPDSWTLPDGLERSTRTHYELALAQEKVAELDAA